MRKLLDKACYNGGSYRYNNGSYIYDTGYPSLKERGVDTDNFTLSAIKIRFQFLRLTVKYGEWNSIKKAFDSADWYGFDNYEEARNDLYRGRIWLAPTICLAFHTDQQTEYYLNLCPRGYGDILWLSDLHFRSRNNGYELTSEQGEKLTLKTPYPEQYPSHKETLSFFEKLCPSLFYEETKDFPTKSLSTIEQIQGTTICRLIETNGSQIAPELKFLRGYAFENEAILSMRIDSFNESASWKYLLDRMK